VFELLNEEGVWQQILKRKYLKNNTLAQVRKKPGDSQFWAGLVEVKEHLLERGKFLVKDGKYTRFWEDWWVGQESLMKQFPALYQICRKKNQTVANVLETRPLNISFRRNMVGDKLRLWNDLVNQVINVRLGDSEDSWVWTLDTKNIFSVKTMYNSMMLSGFLPRRFIVWKLKIPLKIKIFLWYLEKGVTLTKDNLIKRKWKGNSLCCFCNNTETIQHLFFDCHVAKFVWNSIYFTFGIQPPSNITDMLGP